jgi:hypothetical protein
VKQHSKELLRRVGSGQPLTLADYVRAEEALEKSAPLPANEARVSQWLRLMKRFACAAAEKVSHSSARYKRATIEPQ